MNEQLEKCQCGHIAAAHEPVNDLIGNGHLPCKTCSCGGFKSGEVMTGSHYGYCHFTYKNRQKHWRCICDVIKGYLEWEEERKKFKLEYTDKAEGSV